MLGPITPIVYQAPGAAGNPRTASSTAAGASASAGLSGAKNGHA